MVLKNFALLLFILFATFAEVAGQACVGGEIFTREAYLYGRFEVGMRSAAGDGIVSSFFLYNKDGDCDYPAELNEIDLEMTGDRQRILFTTHYPGEWYYTDSIQPAFDPHATLQHYAIEWEPGIVRWFIDDSLVHVQNQSFVVALIHPMRIVMNLWASTNPSWVGVWDPSAMPVESEYDYVRCYAYTPGSGSAGTGNNFSFLWEDHFDGLDEMRWEVEEFGGFGSNYCTFMESSVEVSAGKLYLQLEPENISTLTSPVSFSVDLSQEALEPGDVIYLNGSFNGWCGSCEPMSRIGEIWYTTIDLPPGEYEYLFTKNGWEEIGGAPLESDCDYKACDEWKNYGFFLPADSPPLFLPMNCWGSCGACSEVSDIVLQNNNPKGSELVSVFDLYGRPAKAESGRLLLYFYANGKIEKRFNPPPLMEDF